MIVYMILINVWITSASPQQRLLLAYEYDNLVDCYKKTQILPKKLDPICVRIEK